MSVAASSVAKVAVSRVASIDAYRGLVMLLMAGEVLHFHRVATALPGHSFWAFLAHHQDHVDWRGCVLHDLIQPSFSFLVGVALPWSLASRQAKGDRFGRMVGHTLWRALLLVLLGVFLRSTGSNQTNWTFEDTLSQIGLGYTFLWLLAWVSPVRQWLAFGVVVGGYWLLFALWPLPATTFDWAANGITEEFHRDHWLTGFAAHWNKNANPAHYFDQWWLNLFSRPKPWQFNGGGYVTLSFIPTLGTMLLGLIAGGWLKRTDVPEIKKIQGLWALGLTGLALGSFLDLTGLCPNVKRIWTPAWVLFSGGWCCLLLGAFHGVCDVLGRRTWAFPLLVVGANSIVMYFIAHLWEGFFVRNLKTHLGANFWQDVGGPYGPFLEGLVVLGLFWLCCGWLWRKRVFIRV